MDYCTVQYNGSLWHVLGKSEHMLTLQSFDGHQITVANINAVQFIDEFADCYPEE